MHPPLTTKLWETHVVAERFGQMRRVRISERGDICLEYRPTVSIGEASSWADYDCMFILAAEDVQALLGDERGQSVAVIPFDRVQPAPPNLPGTPQPVVFPKLRMEPYNKCCTCASCSEQHDPSLDQLPFSRRTARRMASKWQAVPFVHHDPSAHWLLRQDDVRNWASFCSALYGGSSDNSEPSAVIWRAIPRQARDRVKEVSEAYYELTVAPDETLALVRTAATDAVNALLKERGFTDCLRDLDAPPTAKALMARDPRGLTSGDVLRLNRLLLEEAYPRSIVKCGPPPTEAEAQGTVDQERVASCRGTQYAIIRGRCVDLPYGDRGERLVVEIPMRDGWAPLPFPTVRGILTPAVFAADLVYCTALYIAFTPVVVWYAMTY